MGFSIGNLSCAKVSYQRLSQLEDHQMLWWYSRRPYGAR